MQRGILGPVPSVGRHLFFRIEPRVEPREALLRLGGEVDGERTILGIGSVAATRMGTSIDGLHDFPVYPGAQVATPSTPSALWLFLRGDDRGELVQRTHRLVALAAPELTVEEQIDVFKFERGLDLTGYEDGTENPEDEDAVRAAFSRSVMPGVRGASYVGVQRFVHDLARFRSFDPKRQDDTIGRRIEDNEEFDDAPDSAHVKRSAQESFEPEAFMVRRSMPFSDEHGDGLVFVGFGESFAAYEAIWKRMLGLEDGVVDALFDFTRPVSGRFFFCPPVREGKLDLRALGL